MMNIYKIKIININIYIMRKSKGKNSKVLISTLKLHPKPTPPPPPLIRNSNQQSSGILSGLGSTLMQGMAWGTGITIARNVIDSAMSSGNLQETTIPKYQDPKEVCNVEKIAFMKCLNNTYDCDMYLEQLKICVKNN